MLHVAFLRNVNQGQRGHPATADVLDVFAEAGARDAAAFQSNGTIVFSAGDPDAVLASIAEALTARGPRTHDVFGMPLAELASIVDRHAPQPDAARRELTLHRGGTIDADDPAVIAEATHRRCLIVDAGAGWLVAVNERDRESNATPVAEHTTGSAATSRGIPTLLRLVARFARE